MTTDGEIVGLYNSLSYMYPYLEPTYFIDSNSEIIRKTALFITEGYTSYKKKAEKLFYFVRDKIKYDPNSYLFRRRDHRVSETLGRGEGNCIHKAVLLTALARVVGIPARLGFKDIRNHMASEALIKIWGGNEFAFHGYSELWLDGKWVIATPAFTKSIYKRYNLKPVEFKGETDAVFFSRSRGGEPSIDYIRDRGIFPDLPFELIKETLIKRIAFLPDDMRKDLEQD